MGFVLINMSAGTDWATGHNERFLEFHMRLPVTKEHYDEQNALLEQEDWKGSAARLIETFPQHEDVIRCWLKGAAQRSRSESASLTKEIVAA